MNKKEAIPVIVVSLLLLCYVILIGLQKWLPVINIIFIISPFALIWMVYSVIRYGEYKGRELENDEEWGYADRDIPHSTSRDVI